MYHNPDVYRSIHNPFIQAFYEFAATENLPRRSAELIFRRKQNEIADAVTAEARIPSPGSAEFVRRLARRPWEMPKFNKDDGVRHMTFFEIKRICSKWLNMNRNAVLDIIAVSQPEPKPPQEPAAEVPEELPQNPRKIRSFKEFQNFNLR